MKTNKLPSLKQQYEKRIKQFGGNLRNAVQLLSDHGILEYHEQYMLKRRIKHLCDSKKRKYIDTIRY